VASVETTGQTIDDAIDAALEQLDLDEDQVDIEVLSEGDEGQPARVRATARAETTSESDALANGTADSAEAESAWDENLATAGREILEDLLDYMGFPGDVDVLRAGKEGGTPTVAMAVVEGEGMGALIGRRGETLQALQFICQLLVNRRMGHWTRVLLDVEGYRSRRERFLKDTALRAAEKAMRYREPIELDPMIPSERRIVHMALATHDYVTTHSEGEGDNRRIIVEPKAEFVRQRGGPEPGGPGRGRPRPFEQRGRDGGGRGGFGRSGGGGRGRGGYGRR
jgi:spoIIIJ-associated protein